jgi:hypothetical protein
VSLAAFLLLMILISNRIIGINVKTKTEIPPTSNKPDISNDESTIGFAIKGEIN